MLTNRDQFTPGEVALLRAVSTRTVLRAIASGELAAFRYGPKTIRISRDGLERWVARCESQAVSHPSQNGASSAKGIHCR